jgi:CDP-2,3-bis-(O-geranylgeranyl)-sn-glycerol synthase
MVRQLIPANMVGRKGRIMDYLLLLELLVLLGLANGAPIIATKLFGASLDAPLDLGIKLRDGAPLFGDSKTIRGVAASIGCTALAAPLLGFDWEVGAGFAAASLSGDLLSSFVKRRLKLEPHAEAFGMDQVPEALLPLLLFKAQLGLTPLEIVVLVVAFVLLAVLLSQLLFRLNIRDRPY